MNRLIPLLMTLAALVSANAYASCNATSCTGLVNKIYVDATNLHVEVDGDGGALGCTLTGKRYISAAHTHPMMREWHGMLLGAFLANRKATVRIVSGSNPCQIGYVVLDRAQ